MESCIISIFIAMLMAILCYIIAYALGYYMLINEVESKHSIDLIKWREKKLE